MPPTSWIELYGAVQSRFYDDMALRVVVAHPSKPADVMRRLLSAARAAWRTGRERPVWSDPKRFRQWLGMKGVHTRVSKRRVKKESE